MTSRRRDESRLPRALLCHTGTGQSLARGSLVRDYWPILALAVACFRPHRHNVIAVMYSIQMMDGAMITMPYISKAAKSPRLPLNVSGPSSSLTVLRISRDTPIASMTRLSKLYSPPMIRLCKLPELPRQTHPTIELQSHVVQDAV